MSQLTGVWQGFGSVLGLLPSAIREIQATYADPVRCHDEVLERWLKEDYNTKKFGPPSWRQLVSAVHSKNGGKNPALAKKIAADHPGNIRLYANKKTSLTANHFLLFIVGKDNAIGKAMDKVQINCPELQTTELNIQQQIRPHVDLQQDGTVPSPIHNAPPCKQIATTIACQPQDESGQL